MPGRCPKCHRGALFTNAVSLVLRPKCDACGLDYTFADSGDGPAVFAIFALGFLVLGGALIAEFKFGAPVWLHVVLWGLLTPLLAIVLLRGLKSHLIALQYRHNAGEGRLSKGDQDQPNP
ncbi:MAG: DUF983 domain-containing protein [Hyphomicrobiaceae bacterium]